jgi:hypothetical protein
MPQDGAGCVQGNTLGEPFHRQAHYEHCATAYNTAAERENDNYSDCAVYVYTRSQQMSMKSGTLQLSLSITELMAAGVCAGCTARPTV